MINCAIFYLTLIELIATFLSLNLEQRAPWLSKGVRSCFNSVLFQVGRFCIGENDVDHYLKLSGPMDVVMTNQSVD